MGTGGQGPPNFVQGDKSFTNGVFRQNCRLSTRVAFLLCDSIFLLPVWRKLHVGHPFPLLKHASHFCTLFQPSRRSANVRYYYFRLSLYRALAQRVRSRRVFLECLINVLMCMCRISRAETSNFVEKTLPNLFVKIGDTVCADTYGICTIYSRNVQRLMDSQHSLPNENKQKINKKLERKQ